jgi:hypothetical protein
MFVVASASAKSLASKGGIAVVLAANAANVRTSNMAGIFIADILP